MTFHTLPLSLPDCEDLYEIQGGALAFVIHGLLEMSAARLSSITEEESSSISERQLLW